MERVGCPARRQMDAAVGEHALSHFHLCQCYQSVQMMQSGAYQTLSVVWVSVDAVEWKAAPPRLDWKVPRQAEVRWAGAVGGPS
jgi:hypothetical protein